mgnify:FL=1
MKRYKTLTQVLIGLWLLLVLIECEATQRTPYIRGANSKKESKGEDLLIKKMEPLLVMFKGTRRQNSLPHPDTPEQRYENEGWYINKISTKKSSIGYVVYAQRFVDPSEGYNADLSVSFLVKEIPSQKNKLTGKIAISLPTFEANRLSGNVLGEFIDRAGQIILNHPIGWDNEKDAIERGSFGRAYGYERWYTAHLELENAEWNGREFEKGEWKFKKITSKIGGHGDPDEEDMNLIPNALRKVFGLPNPDELPLANPKAIEINNRWPTIF